MLFEIIRAFRKKPKKSIVQDKTVTVELIGQKKGKLLLIEGKEFKL